MILAKKNGIQFESLKTHTLKNKWAAECLTTNEKVKQKVSLLDKTVLEAVNIAATFHDLGKANKSFQDKISTDKNNELFPHEILSFLFVFQLFKKYKKDEYYLAAHAILKHHNRNIILNKLPKSSTGLKSVIDNCLNDIKKYTELKKEIEINDSSWIRRSHVDGRQEIIKIEILEELESEFQGLVDPVIIQELLSFKKTINNLKNKAEQVNFFIQDLQRIIRYSNEIKINENINYSRLLLTKSLFKIVDEFASRSDVPDSEIEYKTVFNEMLNDLFFFKPANTELAQNIIDGVLQPNIIQKEILNCSDISNCILLSGNTGSGKTVSAELIKYKKNLNFISYHTPTRFLALEQASRIFDNLEDLLENRKIRYIKEMSVYHHTTDQVYLALTGNRREYLFLKLFFNGVVVFDEIDIFQESKQFFNIIFMLRILSTLKIPVVITTATATPTLKSKIQENYFNEVINEFPKTELENTAIRGTCKILKTNNDYLKGLTDSLINNYENGKRTGIFFNSISSCIILAKELDKKNIPYILYHSRLCSEIKDKNKKILLSLFNKNSLKDGLEKRPIAIMSPIAEVGVDISFETLYSDSSPIRNIEQRIGRLNRWKNFKDCSFYILNDLICGLGTKKDVVFSKRYQGQDIFSYDPYFEIDRTVYYDHKDAYLKLDNIGIGYEQTFLGKINEDIKRYKDLWFEGIICNVKRYILKPDQNKLKPLKETDYKYSLSVLPFLVIQTQVDGYINPCFREVNAQEYQSEDNKREYSSIPDYYFEKGSLKKDYIESEKFGIIKSFLLK